MSASPAPQPPLRIGVSACLVGYPVRFDGSSARDRFVDEDLREVAELVPVCPEVGAGMTVPRPTLRLVRTPNRPRLVDRTGRDWTVAVESFAHAICDRIEALQLCGFVVKSRSPTCGLERVRVYDAHGVPSKDGVGVFTRILRERFPLLPVEEDGRLRDGPLREAFLDAVFACARWRRLCSHPLRPVDLVRFHTRHKYQLLAHDPMRCRELGSVVANCNRVGLEEARDIYGRGLMEAVRSRVSAGRHVNTLQHIAGHLRRHLDDSARAELQEAIDDYRRGVVPRVVPLTLIRHHAREAGCDYLLDQTYLYPFPKELAA